MLFFTGWSRFWSDKQKYRNPDADNLPIFPSLDPKVANYLLEKDIIGIGIDTLSPDRGDSEFLVHSLLLGARKIIIENIANLDAVSACGAYIGVFPLKIKNATESPVRMVAWVKS